MCGEGGSGGRDTNNKEYIGQATLVPFEKFVQRIWLSVITPVTLRPKKATMNYTNHTNENKKFSRAC